LHCADVATLYQMIGDGVLRLALLFFVLGLVAAVLGFGGVAGASFAIAKFLFFVFLILCIIFVVLGFGIVRGFSRR
jgi:uncharacterized membrane protein YtjA (UPF0391 family)